MKNSNKLLLAMLFASGPALADQPVPNGILQYQGPTLGEIWTISPILGYPGSSAGSLGLAAGISGGATVTLQNLSTTSAYNFNLPTSAGTANQVLLSGGGGAAANTWATIGTTANALAKSGTAEVDLTSTTTFTSVTGLAIPLLAGGSYAFHIYLPMSNNALGGGKFTLSTTDTLTATSINYTCRAYNSTSVTAASTVLGLNSTCGAATAAMSDAYIDGNIVVNAAGTLQVSFAQNVSNSTTTAVLANGYIQAVRTN